MRIFTPYITKNGRRIYASQYGKKYFTFEVTEEQHQAYLDRKNKEHK